jgi:hypothetical protein
MKQISGDFLNYVLAGEHPAGSNDDVAVWLDDDNTLYLLVANTNWNYAGLSRKDLDSTEWESVVFVQSNQQEHVDALSFCDVSDVNNYCEGYYEGDDIAVCDSLDIAQLCVDYPERMRDYFMQWE